MSQSKPQEEVILESSVQADSIPFGYTLSLRGKTSYIEESASVFDPQRNLNETSDQTNVPHIVGVDAIEYKKLPDGTVLADVILNIEGVYEDVELRVSSGEAQ